MYDGRTDVRTYGRTHKIPLAWLEPPEAWLEAPEAWLEAPEAWLETPEA